MVEDNRMVDDPQETENVTLFARLYSYSMVEGAVETAKCYYNKAKETNVYMKAGLETAEKYSNMVVENPTVDSLLNSADLYGCKQLDKIEHRGTQIKDIYHTTVKPKTIESLDMVANKIHGTPVEHVLLKTISSVDGVVDALFPPPPKSDEKSEEVEEVGEAGEVGEVSQTPEEQNVVTQTIPIINKLWERVSTESIKLLPSQVYELTKDYFVMAAMPQINHCAEFLDKASQKITSSNSNDAGEHEVSKSNIDHVYLSLQQMVEVMGGLITYVRNLDPKEAQMTVKTLVDMIQASKENAVNKVQLRTSDLKQEISEILLKAGELLSTHASAQYARARNADNATVRKYVETIENLVHSVINRVSAH